MEWMLLPLKRYADFEGRSRRLEYWMFALMNIVVAVALLILTVENYDTAIGRTNSLGTVTLALFLIHGLVVALPSLALQVRRFHDLDKSGWFVLFNLIPAIGPLIVLVITCLPGTTGANRYGSDPKQLR